MSAISSKSLSNLNCFQISAISLLFISNFNSLASKIRVLDKKRASKATVAFLHFFIITIFKMKKACLLWIAFVPLGLLCTSTCFVYFKNNLLTICMNTEFLRLEMFFSQ
jgi:hypothetical protein